MKAIQLLVAVCIVAALGAAGAEKARGADELEILDRGSAKARPRAFNPFQLPPGRFTLSPFGRFQSARPRAPLSQPATASVSSAVLDEASAALSTGDDEETAIAEGAVVRPPFRPPVRSPFRPPPRPPFAIP